MTRYVEQVDRARDFLAHFKLSSERVDELSACKCWLTVGPKWAHIVFRTKTAPDYYEHFSLWHLGMMEPREMWTS